MKKKNVLFILSSFLLNSCALTDIITPPSSNTSEEVNTLSKIDEIYRLYKANGGNLSYEEWLNSVRGQDGDSIELRLTGTMIQWKQSSSTIWIDLFDISSLKGDKGSAGAMGEKGEQGIQGEKGETGEAGPQGEQGIQGEKGDTGAKGEQGIQGEKGIGITSIVKTKTEGLIDTYTITYSDGTTSTFEIINGKNGADYTTTTCTVSFIVDEKEYKTDTVNKTDNVKKPEDPSKEGYSFEGWYTIDGEKWSFYGNVVAQDLKLTAKFIKNEYEVSINGIIGTYYYGDIIPLPVLNNTNNTTFDGYEDSNGIIHTIEYEVKSNDTLTPHYHSTQIILDANGGTCSSNYYEVSKGSTVANLPIAQKDDYIFVGWTYNGNIVEDSFIYNYDGDITLVAQFVSADSMFIYTETNDGLNITSCLLDKEDVIIPSAINGKTVTKVSSSVFDNNSNLKSVYFPNSINTFEDGILENQNNIEKIYISLNANTSTLKLFNATNSNEIPSSFKTIEMTEMSSWNINMFSNDTNLYSFIIPTTSSTSLNNVYFYNAKNIKEVYLMEGITNISTFVDCENLETIHLPTSVTSFSNDAFRNSKITNIYISSLESWCGITNINKLTTKASNKNLYLNDVLLKEITFDENVSEINAYTFYDFASIEKVTLADSITSIGAYSFFHNKNLKEMNLSSKLSSIGACAFRECLSLESIIIPNTITQLKGQEFALCNSLKEVTIPNSVETLEIQQTFFACSKLEKIIYNGSSEEWNTITNKGISERAYSYTVVCNDKNLYPYFNLTLLDDNTYSVSMNKINVGGVYHIASSYYDINVSKIGSYAFSEITDAMVIDTIIIDEGIEIIDDYAFAMSNINNIYIPKSVTYIGEAVFKAPAGNANIYYSGTKEEWNLITKGTNYNQWVNKMIIHCSDGDVVINTNW